MGEICSSNVFPLRFNPLNSNSRTDRFRVSEPKLQTLKPYPRNDASRNGESEKLPVACAETSITREVWSCAVLCDLM